MSASLADVAPYLAGLAGFILPALGWAITYGRQSQRLDQHTKEHDALAARFEAHREESIRRQAHADGLREAGERHAAEVAGRVARLEDGRADVERQVATMAALTGERNARMLDLLKEMERLEEAIERVESTIVIKVGALDGRVNQIASDVRSLNEWKSSMTDRARQHSQEIAAVKGEIGEVERGVDRERAGKGTGERRYVGPPVTLGGDDEPTRKR